MRIFILAMLTLALTACGGDGGNQSGGSTIHDIIPQGIIEPEWTPDQKECAALWLAYLVRFAECSTAPGGRLELESDNGLDLVLDVCINDTRGMDLGHECADAWANDSCEEVYAQACDLWAPAEGRYPGRPAE